MLIGYQRSGELSSEKCEQWKMQSPQIQTLDESERWIPAFAGMTTFRVRVHCIVIPAKAGIHFHCLNRITRLVCRLARERLDKTRVGWVLLVHWCEWAAIPPTKGKKDFPTGDLVAALASVRSGYSASSRTT